MWLAVAPAPAPASSPAAFTNNPAVSPAAVPAPAPAPGNGQVNLTVQLSAATGLNSTGAAALQAVLANLTGQGNVLAKIVMQIMLPFLWYGDIDQNRYYRTLSQQQISSYR